MSRKNVGIVSGESAPNIEVAASPEGLVYAFTVNVCNSSKQRALRVRVGLLDESGACYGRVSTRPVEPAATRDVAIAAPTERLFRAFASGRALQLQTASSVGGMKTPLPADVGVRLFLAVMMGINVPLERKARFNVPSVFRGQPGVLEAYSTDPRTMRREVGRPEMPAREVSPEESATGRIIVGLEAPVGLSNLRARVVFGDVGVRDVVGRLCVLVNEMGGSLAGVRRQGKKGLEALAAGDFAGAVALLQEIYEELARTQPDRSDEVITLVGHAHIDMNWLWGSSETVQCCHDTFRQVLAFMEEFPELTFSQSQASTYECIERIDPEMFERIRRRVREGRWELLGGNVDEGDTNLSSGEGIVRTMLYGQRYFKSRFGRVARVGWLPDNFGHVAQLPQILKLAGMDFFYAHRCQPKLGPYVWEGIDGTRVTAYSTPTYNGEVTPALRELPEQYDPVARRLLWVYGVGDHGGGPTRRDIDEARRCRQLPGFPRIEFGTAEAFFRSLDPVRAGYPVFHGELQYVFEGCYTSIARIKEANRRCENTLYAAELLSSLAALAGWRYPTDEIYDAWHTVAYNQFHDILCGSAVHESNRESIGAYDAALAKADDVLYAALRHLAARVPTRSDLGQPLVVFNPLPRQRTDIVEAEVFSHTTPPTARVPHWGTWTGTGFEAVDVGQGPYATIRLVDEKARPVDAQIVAGKLFPNGYRLKVQFVARRVPACGCRLYYVRPDQPGKRPDRSLAVEGTTITTSALKVAVDPKTGHLVRVYDRKRRKEILQRGRPANVLRVYMEAPHDMSAWKLGPTTAVHTIDKAESVRVVEAGPVRAVVEVKRRWNRSSFTQRVIVYKELARVDFELDARWFELGGPDVDAPMLRVAFPLNVAGGRFLCDSPFAAVERPTNGQEVPAQKWVDLAGRAGGAAILNDGKYGHRCKGRTVEMTLLRASYDPDPYPDQGPHLISYSLYPHAGDATAARVAEEGLAKNVPLLSIETPADGSGDVPPGASLLSLEPRNVYLSAVKKAEEGAGLIVRFHEGHGRPVQARLRMRTRPARATRVNILEQPQEDAEPPILEGHEVRVRVRAHELVTLRVESAGS